MPKVKAPGKEKEEKEDKVEQTTKKEEIIKEDTEKTDQNEKAKEKVDKKETLLLAPPKKTPQPKDETSEKVLAKEEPSSSIWTREISVKTFIVSHLIILIAGLVFLGGLYYILNEGNLPFFNSHNLNNYTPVTSEPISFNLEVTNPEDDLLTFDKNIVISGKTAPEATVIISGNNFDTGSPASQKGDFSEVVTLTTGPNIIKITAFDESGNSKTVLKNVYYSEEKIQ